MSEAKGNFWFGVKYLIKNFLLEFVAWCTAITITYILGCIFYFAIFFSLFMPIESAAFLLLRMMLFTIAITITTFLIVDSFETKEFKRYCDDRHNEAAFKAAGV